jgi:uncharacterized protein (TIRG00374 family)
MSVLVTVGLLAMLLSITDTDTVATTLSSVEYEWYLIGAAISLTSYVPATLRWVALQRHSNVQPNITDAFEIIAISYALNKLLPANTGDMTRSVVAQRYHRISSHTELFSLVVVERVADIVAIVLLISLVTMIVTADLFPSEIVAGVSLGMLLLLGCMIVSIRGKVISSFVPNVALKRLETATNAISIIPVQTLLVVEIYSILRWGLTGLAIVFVGNGLNVEVGFPLAVTAICSMGLMAVVPLSPGGIGVGESVAVTVFVAGGIAEPVAVALALLQRSFGLLWATPLGIVFYVYRFVVQCK